MIQPESSLAPTSPESDAGKSPAEPQSRARPSKPGGVRGSIITAAVQLFHEQSYASTSVNEIVQSAGCTKGAFYHYFKSKQDLLVEIHDEFISYGVRQGRDILAKDYPPDQAMRQLIRELLRQVALYREEMTIVLEEARNMPYDTLPEAKQKRDDYEDIVLSILERGIAEEVFRDDLASTRVLSFGIMGMCVWAYRWLSDEGDLTPDAVADLYADVILDGLKRPDGNSQTGSAAASAD